MFHPQSFRLDNGMDVLCVPNRRAPVVAHYVWYRVGTADSPQGKSGLPHFLEHLMFKGTSRIPPGEFSKIVARHGGNDNAFTSNDFTAYFQNIARDRLELVMDLEADRMANLQLSDEHVYPERDVILEERKQRVDNEPQSLLSESVSAAQFLHHPYRLPVIGWMHEIADYTREDAFAFYERWYAPNNAILIVVGDIDADELRPLAEKAYGAIPSRPVPERRRLREPPQHAERRLTLVDEKVQQPLLLRSYMAPSAVSAGKEHSLPLEVLSEIFAGGSTSRLYQSMVVERGVAAGVGGGYRSSSLDPTSMRLYASPRPGTEIAKVEAALDEEIARLLEGGVTQDEFERTKKKIVAETTFARDSISGVAHIFGTVLTTGGDIDDVELWPERIMEVTREQVEAAARHVLVRQASVTGTLMPAGTAPSGGEAA